MQKSFNFETMEEQKKIAETVVNEYISGLSMEIIAYRNGLTLGSVRKILQDNNIVRRSRGRK